MAGSGSKPPPPSRDLTDNENIYAANTIQGLLKVLFEIENYYVNFRKFDTTSINTSI